MKRVWNLKGRHENAFCELVFKAFYKFPENSLNLDFTLKKTVLNLTRKAQI